MPDDSKKSTIAILMLVIAVITITTAALAGFYSLKNTVDDLEKRCPESGNALSRGALPIGSIIVYHGTGVSPSDSGWLLCNGGDVPDKPKFTILRSLIGTNTPDLRGMFLRGAGQNKEERFQYIQETPRLVGHLQGYATAPPRDNFRANLKHTHGQNRAVFLTVHGGGKESGRNEDGTGTTSSALSDKQNTSEAGGDEETRPNNYTVNFIIKAF